MHLPLIRHTGTHHLTRPPPPRFGFCFNLGFASWATSVGADLPIKEYSSRDMPSGLRARSVVPAGLGCEGPGADGVGRENTERTSAALGPAMFWSGMN